MQKKDFKRTSHVVKNSFWAAANKVLHMVMPFLLRAFVVREIGAAYVGMNGLFRSVLSMLNVMDLGIGSAIVYMMYKPVAEDDKESLSAYLALIRKLYRIIGAAMLAVGLAIIPFLDRIVNNDTGVDINYYLLYFMYLGHAVMSYLMFGYRGSLFSAHQRSDVLSKTAFVFTIIQYVGQCVILIVFRNYYLYILWFAVLVIPQSVVNLVLSKKAYPGIVPRGQVPKEQQKVIFKKVGALFGHKLAAKMMLSVDDIILASFIGVSILTKYDNYHLIFSSIAALLDLVIFSFTSSIGNKLVMDSVESNYLTFRKLTFIWISVTCFCSACFISMYQPFIAIWVGKDYLFEEYIVIIISLYFYASQFRKVGLITKDAAGLWEADKVKPYVAMVVNTTFSILFVKLTGNVLGVLLPTIFCMFFISFPWETHVIFKHIFVKQSKKEYYLYMLHLIFTSSISVAAGYFVCRLLPQFGIIWMIIKGSVSVIISLTIFVLCNIRTAEFKGATKDVTRYCKNTAGKIKKKFIKTV